MKDTLTKLVEMLPFDGAKSYIGGMLLIVYGVATYFGFLDCEEPMIAIGNGLGLIGIRHAMTKFGLDSLMVFMDKLPAMIALIQEMRRRQIDPTTPVMVDDIIEIDPEA